MKTLKQLIRNSEEGRYLSELEDNYVNFYMKNLEATIDNELIKIPYKDLVSKKDIILNLPTLHVSKMINGVDAPFAEPDTTPDTSKLDFDLVFKTNPKQEDKVHPFITLMKSHQIIEEPISSQDAYYRYLYNLNTEVDIRHIMDAISEQFKELIHQYQENEIPISKYVIGFYSTTGDEDNEN